MPGISNSKTLLLHTCCAPCALPILEHLAEEKKVKNIILYFYNPNIFPQQEYTKRLKQVKKIAKAYNLKLVIEKHDHQKWLNYLCQSLPHPLESYPENNERCLNCFVIRLNQTIKYAQEKNISYFATTLSINRFKNIEFINSYGLKKAKELNLNYATFDLDPFKAHQLELKLVKKYNLYSQKYCGCEFST